MTTRDTQLRDRGWVRAHRQALIAGEFVDDCDHGRSLFDCDHLECWDLYEVIVKTYLYGGGRGKAS